MTDSTEINNSSLCPSARSNWEGSKIFGIVGGEVEAPKVNYFKQAQLPIESIAKLNDRVTPEEVFRIAAPCAEKGCQLFFDKRGNNPYCHHRALTQAERGIRERFTIKRKAEGNPFDNGEFELLEEACNESLPVGDLLHFRAEHIQWPQDWDRRTKSMQRDEILLNPVLT